MARTLPVLVMVPFLLVVVACTNSTAGNAFAPTSAPVAAAPTAPAETGAAPDEGGCPLSAADLSAATSLNWKLGRAEADYPLETLEKVTATVCVFTSADRPQFGGDPLVLRVDQVTGTDAAALRANFEDETCRGNGGTVEPAAGMDGGLLCQRDGVAVEGAVADDDTTTHAYFVNADIETAELLSPSMAKILAAVA